MAAERFIGRWSRLKRGAEVQGVQPTPDEASVEAGAVARQATEQEVVAASDEQRSTGQDQRVPQPLPAIESLGKHSDFSAFMQADVDPVLRVSALKKLFTDPHFNRMDGLDIYIDDYSKPDPMPLAFIRRLGQSRMLGLSEEAAQDRTPLLDEATEAAADEPASAPGGSGAMTASIEEAAPAPADEATAVGVAGADATAFDEPTAAGSPDEMSARAAWPPTPDLAPGPERLV